ncbi:helix-turn-helix domain-containing protein [Planomonospora algeriensis]
MRAFGYGPKTLQRVVRFQRALRLAGRGTGLAEVALASGYADQSHMSNEVRRLAGVPLRQLVNRP